MTNEINYSEVFGLLKPVLPQEWKQIILYLEYGQTSYSFAYYVNTGTGQFVKCYDLPGISDEAILNAFSQIDTLIKPQQKEECWTNATIRFDSENKITIDYDYTDLTNHAYQYRKNWKLKYLK